MKEHKLTQDQIDALRPFHRLFQTAISVTANKEFGIENTPLPIVNHLGGGIVVNKREIAISSWLVRDLDKPLFREPSAEEKATVKAIQNVAALFLEQGKAAFKPFVAKRPPDGLNDPLRSLFNLDGYIPV